MRFKLKTNLSSNSDCLQQHQGGIWVNLEERREKELDLNKIYSYKFDKYPKIYLLLKEFFRTEFGSATATFQAFDGKEIHGHIYQKVFSLYNSKISVGNLLELVNVTVLSIDGEKQLFVDSGNIAKIIVAKDYGVIKGVEITQKEAIKSSTVVASRISKKGRSSGRLRLSDVTEFYEADIHRTDPLPERNETILVKTSMDKSSMDAYDLLNQELEENFQDF